MIIAPLFETNIDTVVIGAGPTGLAMSYLLKKDNVDHIVLEGSDCVAKNWRNLWDNYKLAMSANQVEFPGEDFSEHFSDDHHPTNVEIINFFEPYTKTYKLPIQYRTQVEHLLKNKEGSFIVTTSNRKYLCNNVVCCIGPRQEPLLPESALAWKKHDESKILHSSEYKSSTDFKEASKILIVGSGLSALSLAKDLADEHQVTLACKYTDAEIKAKNEHIYSGPSSEDVIPLLADLELKGINNIGQFICKDGDDLNFEKDNKITLRNAKDFDKVIFATGFKPSYKILNQLISPESYESDELVKSSTPEGLYLAGVLPEGATTVTISGGTQDALKIAAQMRRKAEVKEKVAASSLNHSALKK